MCNPYSYTNVPNALLMLMEREDSKRCSATEPCGKGRVSRWCFDRRDCVVLRTVKVTVESAIPVLVASSAAIKDRPYIATGP